MRLPLKFLPWPSQQIAEVAAAVFITLFSLALVINYLPDQPAAGQGFDAWFAVNRLMLLFLAITVALFLAGLGWIAVTVINLTSGSPFKYLVVDRFGITHRVFLSEKRYSWKDLETIKAHRVSLWRARSNEQRYWIVESHYSNPGGMKISAGDFVGSGWLFGNIALATEDTANWLESLRLLARADRLEPDDIPPPPSALRAPIEIDYAATVP